MNDEKREVREHTADMADLCQTFLGRTITGVAFDSEDPFPNTNLIYLPQFMRVMLDDGRTITAEISHTHNDTGLSLEVA